MKEYKRALRAKLDTLDDERPLELTTPFKQRTKSLPPSMQRTTMMTTAMTTTTTPPVSEAAGNVSSVVKTMLSTTASCVAKLCTTMCSAVQSSTKTIVKHARCVSQRAITQMATMHETMTMVQEVVTTLAIVATTTHLMKAKQLMHLATWRRVLRVPKLPAWCWCERRRVTHLW
jgi:hypothetical protein